MNVLTFDVEEWFHLLDFDATRTEEEWGAMKCVFTRMWNEY